MLIRLIQTKIKAKEVFDMNSKGKSINERVAHRFAKKLVEYNFSLKKKFFSCER